MQRRVVPIQWAARARAPSGSPERRSRVPGGPGDPPQPAPQPLVAWSAARGGHGPCDRAETRLVGLAGAVGPLRRVLAAVAERFVASRAHERLCYARLSDYARERPGLSARQLQELARVHRALAGLPALDRALQTNALPWSKVRLLARVATAEDEHRWLARARALPTRRLEQEVKATPAAPSQEEDAEPRVRVAVRCTPAVREKWLATRELAERVAGERLGADEVLELVAAEAFSSLSIDPARAAAEGAIERRARGRGEAEEGAHEVELPARAPERELPPEVTALADGLDEADPFELDRRLRVAVRLEQTLDAAVAPLLRVVTSPEHEWQGPLQTLATCAREQLGLSPSKARALLRLERACDLCPELRAAYRSGRLSWVKAQCLLPLLGLDLPGEWRPAWVAWAARVTVRRLAEDVERALLLRAGHHLAWQRCKFEPERAQEAIPPEERQLCAHDVDPEATQQLHWRVPPEVATLFVAVRETLRARLEAEWDRPVTDGEAFEGLLDCALRAWRQQPPGAARGHPIVERDGYRCAVPGCTSRRNLHEHHITFRSAGGSDAPDNLVTLCAFHHQRCLHAGRMAVRGRAPAALVFEMGTRTGAAPLARYASGDVALLQRNAV